MNGLETRYRRVLRWYPKKWRASNEDTVLGTLLDKADHDERRVPERGELANLRGSALAARFAVIDRVVPTGVRDRAALIALALGFTLSASGIVLTAYEFTVIPAVDRATFAQVGTLYNLGVVFYATWVLALATALIGLRRLTSVLVGLSLPFSIAVPLISRMLHLWGSPGSLTVGFLDALALIYLFGSPRVAGRFRRPLAILTGVTLLSFIAMYVVHTNGYWGYGAPGIDWFWEQYALLLTWVGTPAVVIASVILWRLRGSAWAPAMLLAAVPILPLTVLEFGYAGSWYYSGGVALIVLIVAAAIVSVVRLFGFRVTITRA